MADERPERYEITDPRQLETITSARRQDILDRLAAYGPLSVRELAEHVGARPSALYHHLQRLIEVGLVVEAGSRIRRRKREQLYNTPSPQMRLLDAFADPRNAELMMEIVAAQSRQMIRDFRAGLSSPAAVAEGQFRTQAFFRLVGRPTPAQLARINACVLELIETMYQSNDPDSPLIALSLVMSPLDVSADDDSET
jgi:DNA-binding transcriptional ArsR family regulator